MDIIQATRLYERWLANHITLVKSDLAKKHQNMELDCFVFLRATCYRWAQLFPELCPELMDACEVDGVVDLHIENYGTWRDTEARLIWGVNDDDEAARIPFTADLVRLATSARFAISKKILRIDRDEAYNAILSGYKGSLKCGGRPFVLAEQNTALREIASSRLREPVVFWQRIRKQLTAARNVPAEALSVLASQMPEPGLDFDVFRRQAGQGSLGRQRYVALATWRGGLIAREVKARVPSAWSWATSSKTDDRSMVGIFHQNTPGFRVVDNWTVRRLAPDSSKIDVATLAKNRDERLLLESMGWEAGNIHLATTDSASLLAYLRTKKSNWLHSAAKTMAEGTREDWEIWRNR